ncbi:MAG: T9SS type A sorting domain-containing protein [Alphaproteobacteria bacterium]|nr:T9SS type A sorting domain-containing protein [Alphaproteobacteria bacterium]
MKKMYNLIVIALMLFPAITFSQAPAIAWTKLYHPVTFGMDVVAVANDGLQLADGGYIALGTSYAVNAYLVRTNALGDTLWTKQIFNDFLSGKVITGTNIELAGDGGFFISGFGTNMTDAGVWLLKTDANGNLSWWKFQSYGGVDTVFLTTDLRVTPDGGVILCGSYKSLLDYFNVFMMKFDQQGNYQWQKRFGNDFDEAEGFSIENAYGGGYIQMVGNNSAGIETLRLIKVNSLGVVEWDKDYPDVMTFDYGMVRQTLDNHYIITGEDDGDYFLMKITPDGDIVWLKNYGFAETEQEATSVDPTSDGGYVMTGMHSPAGTAILDIWVVKTDGSGNEEWSKEINLYEYNDRAVMIQQTADGGYILFGQSRINPEALDNVLMIKLGPTGNIEELSGNQGNLVLCQNQPNPVSSVTTIKYSTLVSQNIRLSVSNFTGREIMLLQDEYRVAGSYEKSVDMTNLPCGIYTIQLRAGSQFLVKKILKVQD